MWLNPFLDVVVSEFHFRVSGVKVQSILRNVSSLCVSRVRITNGDVQLGLLAGSTKIAPKSLLEAFLVVLEHVAYLDNLRLPKFHGPGPARPECRLGGGMDLRKGDW